MHTSKNTLCSIYFEGDESCNHRHPREIDRSSAIVVGLAAAQASPGNGTESGGISIHWPAFSAKTCFLLAGDITTSVNKGRQARPMSGLSHLDVYVCNCPTGKLLCL